MYGGLRKKCLRRFFVSRRVVIITDIETLLLCVLRMRSIYLYIYLQRSRKITEILNINWIPFNTTSIWKHSDYSDSTIVKLSTINRPGSLHIPSFHHSRKLKSSNDALAKAMFQTMHVRWNTQAWLNLNRQRYSKQCNQGRNVSMLAS